MKILVTGGAGYIGSHTAVELAALGHEIVIIDNLSNSKKTAVKRVEEITGKTIPFYEEDVCNAEALKSIFEEHKIDAVMHFAALKAVGESVEKPVEYYYNNLISTLVLLKVMKEKNCKNIVFSSSATVYGDPKTVPITEDFPLSATNPYGETKLMIENILKDTAKADPDWNIAILRYFNPIGAHSSGKIGEDPKDIPNNIAPYIAKVAAGKLKKVSVFGNNYPTPDGTGVRDYIHVVDLAKGHVKAIEKLFSNPGIFTVNLGTGCGYSVLELINAFEKASGNTIPYEITERRPGDIAICYANPQKAYDLFGWKAEKTLEQMCEDAWRWQKNNPNGYEE